MGRVKTEILVVESEAIAYANYGHEAKQLYVMWKSGQGYTYHSVPLYVWRGLQTAPSFGRFLVYEIKDKYQTIADRTRSLKDNINESKTNKL